MLQLGIYNAYIVHFKKLKYLQQTIEATESYI